MSVNSTPNGKSDTTDTAPDRRRPGRIAYTNRFLIDLLREKPATPTAEGVEEASALTQGSAIAPGDTDDDLAPAIGIFVSVVVSLALWAIILLIIWPLIHSGDRLDIRRTRSSAKQSEHSDSDMRPVWYAAAQVVPWPSVHRPAASLPWGASF
jgi:hypothetical protein